MLNLNGRPLIMGILNVTPDSFSDGGCYIDCQQALAHGLDMEVQGADIIDIGGESTRPGAQVVDVQTELDRVIPVIESIRARSDIPISVDTSSPDVMLEAAVAGASMINDVRALGRAGALEAASCTKLPVCLMHMQGQPQTMQVAPSYEDLIADILGFFEARIQACIEAGISEAQILLDPGFGFGKSPQHNLNLIAELNQFAYFEKPILVGLSRKSTIGLITGDERLIASVTGAVLAVQNGANIVRVHDVKETASALAMLSAVQTHGRNL